MLTIILVIYKTDKNKLRNILKRVGSRYNILIVDNSYNYNFKNIKLTKKTKIIRSQNNGNGAGINIALKNCKTENAIYTDIDVKFHKNFIKELINISKKIKNFSVLVPNHGKFKKESKIIKNFIGEAPVMFFNLRNLRKINFFDENFFLYYEEVDILFRSIKNNFPTYLIPNLRIKHERATSTINSKRIKNLRQWHYMWSMFYFYKKHYNFFIALNKTFKFLIKDTVIFLIYFITFNFKKSSIRFFRLYGLICSILGFKSFLRE